MEANSPDSSSADANGRGVSSSSAASAAPILSEKPNSASEANEELSIMQELQAFGGWCRKNPVEIALLIGIVGFFVWLYGFHHTFISNTVSTMRWMWDGADPDSDQGHGRMVPFIAAGLIWMSRYRLKAAAGPGSNWGLAIVGVGVAIFILSVRCLQPRMALTAIPFFLLGSVSFIWGNKAARVVLFPACFLLFMIPVAAISQATFRLQFLITESVGFIAQILGIGIQAMGTTLTAVDGSFNFEIAEGCSGIRSLAAMTMLTAVYVHLTQDRLWKKIVIFGGSLIFAVIGNIGRIMAIVLTARFYDPEFAAGIMHDYSGYIFFPVAVITMLIFAKLVNVIGDAVTGRGRKSAAVAVEGGAQ